MSVVVAAGCDRSDGVRSIERHSVAWSKREFLPLEDLACAFGVSLFEINDIVDDEGLLCLAGGRQLGAEFEGGSELNRWGIDGEALQLDLGWANSDGIKRSRVTLLDERAASVTDEFLP